MIFNRSAIEAVASAWAADREDERKRRTTRVLPEIEKLAWLIEVAFTASLQRVEERSTRFALAILPRTEDDHGTILQGRRSELLPFESAIPLSADALAKLATACDPSLGCLLVDVAGENRDDCLIWGISFYEPSGIGFGGSVESGIACSMNLGAMRPDTLMISSLSPGSLDITRGDSRIGQFVRGSFVPALVTPLSKAAMGAYIGTRILEKGTDLAYGNWYFWEYLRWLEYLLAEIGRRGHGGTLIFCPEVAWTDMRPLCQGGQRVSGDLSLAQIIDARHREEQEMKTAKGIEGMLSGIVGIDKCNEHMMNRLSFIAQLAVCDGAVVMCEHFKPLVYGTMLPARDWEGKVLAGQDGYGHGGEAYDLSQHGMRHRSAAAFIGSHEELFGFVVSQDGPIRGFVRSEDASLLVWRDCRTSMFV